MKVFNNNFPIEAVDIKYRNNHSWLPKSLAKSIKKKNELYYSSYKTYENKLNSILRNKQRKYHSDQLELHRSNPLKSWKIMKHVLGKQRKFFTNEQCFNINGTDGMFHTIVKTLRQNILYAVCLKAPSSGNSYNLI